MDGLLNSVTTIVANLGLAAATLGFVILGIKAIIAAVKGEGLRSIFSGAGAVAAGLILIGAAGAIAAAIKALAGNIH